MLLSVWSSKSANSRYEEEKSVIDIVEGEAYTLSVAPGAVSSNEINSI